MDVLDRERERALYLLSVLLACQGGARVAVCIPAHNQNVGQVLRPCVWGQSSSAALSVGAEYEGQGHPQERPEDSTLNEGA